MLDPALIRPAPSNQAIYVYGNTPLSFTLRSPASAALDLALMYQVEGRESENVETVYYANYGRRQSSPFVYLNKQQSSYELVQTITIDYPFLIAQGTLFVWDHRAIEERLPGDFIDDQLKPHSQLSVYSDKKRCWEAPAYYSWSSNCVRLCEFTRHHCVVDCYMDQLGRQLTKLDEQELMSMMMKGR